MTTETAEIVYDLFVSYVEDDYGWVDGFLLDALKAAGVNYYSEAEFEVGKPRIIQFEAEIKRSKYTLLVISPAYLVDNASQFIRSLGQSYGMDKADTWPVIPLLLHPVELPSGLAQLELLDATDPDRWPKAIERLCAQAQRPLPPPPAPPPCPYPGMVPFDETNIKQF